MVLFFKKNRLNKLAAEIVYTWDEREWSVARGHISLEDLL